MVYILQVENNFIFMENEDFLNNLPCHIEHRNGEASFFFGTVYTGFDLLWSPISLSDIVSFRMESILRSRVHGRFEERFRKILLGKHLCLVQ